MPFFVFQGDHIDPLSVVETILYRDNRFHAVIDRVVLFGDSGSCGV